MFDINSIGQQLNWDYIFPSQVGQATLHGIANGLPNSDANLVKKFNQQQFSPINYLPHTANNSLQAQYGINQFKEGGEFTGDMDKDMEDFIMGQEESNTPLPTHEQSTQQEDSTPASSYVDEVQNEYANEQIANSIIYSTHQRARYDENGIMAAPRTHGVNLQGIQPDVMQAGQELLSKFPGLQITSGVRNWGDKDAHPLGRAMDVSGDSKTLKAASEYYSNEIVPKYKFNKALPINHGTGPHIHLGYYDEGGSVVDYLEGRHMYSDKESRAILAKGFGIKDYDYSATKNTELLNALKNEKNNNSTSENGFVPLNSEAGRIPERHNSVSVSDVYEVPQVSYSKKQNNNQAFHLPQSATQDWLAGYMSNKDNFKPEQQNSNIPKVPSSGVVVDKRTGKAYITKNGHVVSNFPVLTGQNVEGNKNDKPESLFSSLPWEERNTPTGYYEMSNDLSTFNKLRYNGLGMNMTPISAFGMEAPKGVDLQIHKTSNPSERDKYFDTNNSYQTNGCINCHKPDIENVMNTFPHGDTLMVIDSKDSKFAEATKQIQRKYNFGGKFKK